MLANLVRKFPVAFGRSISSLSLRHATLAWAAAFSQLHLPYAERIQYHLETASKALHANFISETLDEADLYAASILTYFSCICIDLENFEARLKWVGLIMHKLSVKLANRCSSNHLWKFFPLARDLILEGSRRLAHTNDLVITFSYFSARVSPMGPTSFQDRALYIDELFGYDPTQQQAFSHTIWHHCTALRRSFRDTIERKIKNKPGTSFHVQALVSEVKADINSDKMRDIVERLSFHQTLSEYNHQIDTKYQSSRLALLLRRFCLHLIILLEADDVIQGISSREAISSALSILQLVDYGWLDPNSYIYLWMPEIPLCFCRHIIIRILWTVGLTLTTSETFSEGTFPLLYGLRCN